MKIDPGTGDRYFIMHETAQSRRDRRRLRIPHIRIADEGGFAGKFRRIRLEKRDEAWRTRFFFSFEEECGANRQSSARHDPGPRSFKEGHELALVVGSAAAIEPLDAVLALLANRFEWRACPFVQGIGRLDIIVAVEQDMAERFGTV